MGDRDALVRAYRTGGLLEAIREAISPDPIERKSLASDLAALHNEGTLDLIATFAGLPGPSESGSRYSLLRGVFEEALPELEAPVPEVAKCVQRLYREAGPDGAAGTVADAFGGFCASRPERVPAALAAIEAAPEELSDLLIEVLVAGSRIDPGAYADEAIRLAGHMNLELRRRALLAIGRLDLAKATGGCEKGVAVIERAVEAEVDDQILACAIKSAFALSRAEGKAAPKLTAAIATALARGGEISLHAASAVFGFHTSDIAPDLLKLLLERLAQVEISNKGTLDNIDYGVAHLLKGKDVAGGLRFLEALLTARTNELGFSAFDDTARTIRDTPALRSKVATRWFLSGESALCESVKAILDSARSEFLEIEADASELASAEPARLLFGARKAIGYLLLRPISAASFLVSLLRQAPADPQLRNALEALLLNPLLINFSGSVAEYLSSRAATEEEPVRGAIRRVLDALERYLDGLKSVGEIAALHPSLEHRDAYRRHFASEVARSFKKVQAESVLLQLVHRTVLLYGRKAIHHVYGPEGEIHRMETDLGEFGTQIEVPRLTVIDPQGLDYMLRKFQRERLDP